MKRIQTSTATPHLKLAPLAAIIGAGLLAACGGGGDGGIGSGGTGQAPANGLAVGTINGFGSIFVAGVRCDDTRAKVAYNTATGTAETGTPEVKLGQRVQITFDAASATCKVVQALVDPELVGRITSLSPLTVAGQRVSIVTDGATAPATVFEGYADAAALRVGDRVEVHGDVVTLSGLSTVQATRIERKPANDTWVRARGVVAGLTATQFTIGGLTVNRNASTLLDPTDLALANGQTLVVWSTGAPAVDGSITAKVIKLAKRSLADQQAVRVEGVASGCAAAPCTLPTLDGLSVDLAAATYVNGNLADIANGVALRVEGTWDGVRSRLVASKVSVRLRDTAAAEVNLIGLVSDFVSSTDFSVRGMQVTTNAGTVLGSGCSIGAGQIVGVKGLLSQSQVVATKVDCLTLTDGTTLDIFGGLLNVNTTARTFNLSEGPYRDLTLAWDDDTVFGADLTPAKLANNLRVGLRAVLVDGKLLVKRLIADPTPTNAPAGVQVFGNFGIAQDVSAGSLTVRKIQMGIVAATVVNGPVVDGTPVRVWFYRTGPAQPWIALQVNKVTWN